MRLLGVACLAGLTGARAGASSSTALSRLLLSALRAAPDDAEQALKELDIDRDGYVQLSEVSGYASAKGLDYQATVKEFASYDADHDGRLNMEELANVLGIPQPSRASAGFAAQADVVDEAMAEASPPPAYLRSRTRDLQSRAAQLIHTAPAAPASLRKTGSAASAGASAAAVSPRQRTLQVAQLAAGLSLEVSREGEAQDLDLAAAEARERLAVLKRSVWKKVREASTAAATAKAAELAKNLTALEEETLRTEVKAAAVRAKMAADVKQVNDLSAIVKEGLASIH